MIKLQKDSNAIIERTARKIERHEQRADTFSTLLRDSRLAAYVAATSYNKAAELSNSIKDKDQERRLLLRAANSFEDLGAMSQQEAEKTSGRKRAKRYLSAYKSFIEAAYAIHQLNQPNFNNRERNLMVRAERILEIIPDVSIDFSGLFMMPGISRWELEDKVLLIKKELNLDNDVLKSIKPDANLSEEVLPKIKRSEFGTFTNLALYLQRIKLDDFKDRISPDDDLESILGVLAYGIYDKILCTLKDSKLEKIGKCLSVSVEDWCSELTIDNDDGIQEWELSHQIVNTPIMEIAFYRIPRENLETAIQIVDKVATELRKEHEINSIDPTETEFILC